MDNNSSQNNSALRSKAFGGFFWRFLERTGAELVTFVVSVILARLLDPDYYGLVAMASVIVAILNVFVDSGFGNALIQKKNADELDFSTVFFFNIGACICMYLLLYFTAPYMASFYKMPDLTYVIRVLGLILIISGLKNIQQAYVSRHMLFKRFFFATLGGTLGAAAIGIFMAYKGYGVWALVAQTLFNTITDTVILWFTVPWRPKLIFSFNRLKGLFNYGWKMLASAIIDRAYNELRTLCIGRLYQPADLAYYRKAGSFPKMIVTNINSAIASVLMPLLSQKQDDTESVRNITSMAIKTTTFLIMPAMMGLAICAESFVLLLLTEKWLPCVPFIRIACFTYAFYPIHTTNLVAIQALGRSDIFLKLEIFKKIFNIIILIITVNYGVLAIAYGGVAISIANQLINSWPNKKLLNYSYLQQLNDMLPQIILSLVMGAIVYPFTFLKLSPLTTLLIQIPCGIFVYFAMAHILNLKTYNYFKKISREFIAKKFKK